MKRKTSDVPTIVYKYALKPPTANAELVDSLFRNARAHYNKLVTIENIRRRRYRDARSRLFPAYADLEVKYSELATALDAERSAAKLAKSATRSRKVDAGRAAKIAELRKASRQVSEQLKGLRTEVASHPDLQDASYLAIEESRAAVRALRKETYWGTYQLVEEAIQQAVSKSKHDVAYNEKPDHLLSSRLGMQFQGGISSSDLVGDTRMQVVNPPTWRQTPSGHFRPCYQRDDGGSVKRCTLKFRVGSDDDRKPVWAEFPLAYDRPLPEDAKIVKAYVTRRHCAERTPWQYHLCIVLETRTYERTVSLDGQVGETAVNFGWRILSDGGLRVATMVRDRGEIEHVELPARFLTGMAKVRELQGLLDEKFEAFKRHLVGFIAANDERLPEGFKESFSNVGSWKSQHKLCDLCRYWEGRRFGGDDEIYALAEAWRERYLHLYDWMTYQRRSLLRFRDDLYGRAARRMVEGAKRIVLDTFDLSAIARKPRAESPEKGSRTSRDNRTLASPSDLRERVLRAAKKYHCEVVAADPKDGTRRCNACGSLQEVTEVEHSCKICEAMWDQDVNNADNLLDKSASGEVVEMVAPAQVAKGGEVRPSRHCSYGSARSKLAKSLKTK